MGFKMQIRTGLKSNKTGHKAGTPLTEEKFVVYLEGIKDLIASTAKGTETVLKKEIHEVRDRVSRTEVAIIEHSRLIKALDVKIDDVRTELKGEIKSLDVKIDDVRTELKKEIQGVRTELKEEMHQMEGRLSEKIDGQSMRINNHETRISLLEQRPVEQQP